MGSAEAELQSVWMRWMERILSGKPSAKCPFNCIIMEKGGYWVGACFMDWIGFCFSTSASLSLPSNQCSSDSDEEREGVCNFVCVFCFVLV